MQSLPRNDFIRKSARWEPYHCFRRNIMGSSEAVSHCKPSQHRRPRSDQRKRRPPLFFRELVARLDRSAFQLSAIFPDAGTTALNFQGSPSPVLMVSVSDDLLSKIVGKHSARAVSPEHIVLYVNKLNSGEYRLWRSRKLGEMDVNCHV